MRKLKVNEFFDYKFLSNVSYSPKGKSAAFVVRTTDEKDNKYPANIWLHDKAGLKKLTGLDQENSFIFEDDDHILFPAVRDDIDKHKKAANDVFTSFYCLDINGGEAQKAFTIPLSVSSIQILNDGLYVVVANTSASHPDFHKYDEEKLKELKQEAKDNDDYEILDEMPWWFNGVGFKNKMRQRMYIYNSEKDTCTAVTNAFFQTASVKVSADKKMILYTGSIMKEKSNRTSGIYLYDVNKKTTTTLVKDGKYSVKLAHFYQKGFIVCMNDGKDWGMNQNGDFYLLDAKGNITNTISYGDSIGSTVGSDCRFGGGMIDKVLDDAYYFVTTIRNSSHLYRIHKNKIEKVIEKEGSIDCFDISGSNVLMSCLYDMNLQELYQYNISSKKMTQVSSFNKEVLKDVYVAKPKLLQVKSRDTSIDGWVLEPKDYNKNKKYPAILNIHGGPKTVYGEVFYHEMQYWANEGFFVFFCNPVGSDGRGNEFMDIRGKYGTIDYEDFMNFTDAVLKKYPAINPKKVGVTGGSYGGYMTNWIIGHTDRFVAAASQRSISNWVSFYGNSDIGPHFTKDQQGVKDIYEGSEKLWWHSPLKYANKVSTPTLFIHSDADYRCWIPEGLQMFTALKDRGVESRFCWFKGENHELSRSGKPTHRVKRLEEITGWISKYTK